MSKCQNNCFSKIIYKRKREYEVIGVGNLVCVGGGGGSIFPLCISKDIHTWNISIETLDRNSPVGQSDPALQTFNLPPLLVAYYFTMIQLFPPIKQHFLNFYFVCGVCLEFYDFSRYLLPRPKWAALKNNLS